MSKTSTRFSSDDYLSAFRSEGRFPDIHDPITNMVVAEAMGTSGVDLGCCFGLLGQRLMGESFDMFGVEANAEYIKQGMDSGITLPMYHLAVTAETMGQLIALIKEHAATILVARRAFPEVFPDPTQPFCKEFAGRIREAGITEVFLQGRLESGRSTHPLKGVDYESEILLTHYRRVYTVGQLCYLKAL